MRTNKVVDLKDLYTYEATFSCTTCRKRGYLEDVVEVLME